ncbi:hypothetical protein SAM23877_6347 [Streptomyces ambofaciens ATCC 23877]|uniref:Uncharacterized protein n=1 Tax=Streptomyces ambofaciens (strain ATCC 23877 / 3486 / DSM 40053 / JCM 4204 / NBRC 12836 / NRRL B-2516) TaxID=278992 RepID=A0A0K2B2R7_STRA7|nr:hypothetical protein SAM23877_6347 [Streptomyces ambofaciens ATCC 23877]
MCHAHRYASVPVPKRIGTLAYRYTSVSERIRIDETCHTRPFLCVIHLWTARTTVSEGAGG